MFVAVEFRQGNQFGLEPARFARCKISLLAAQGKHILVGAHDLVFRGQPFHTAAHMFPRQWIHQAIPEQRIHEFAVPEPVAGAGPLQ